MDINKGSCVGVIVVVVVLALAVGSVAYFANVSAVKANTVRAQATAQAELLARSTPMSEEAIIALHGMDAISEVAQSGFDSNVAIAASGDAAQASMSMAWCASLWALPVGLVALGFILWVLQGRGKDEK